MSYLCLSHFCLDELQPFATVRVCITKSKHAVYFILPAFLALSGGKRAVGGITWSRALHVLHSRRLRRDYPRPDVSFSKWKTRCPLRSSHILPLVSVKQQGVGGRLSGASRRLSLNMQDFRFRKRSPFNVVDASSIILKQTFTKLTDWR